VPARNDVPESLRVPLVLAAIAMAACTQQAPQRTVTVDINSTAPESAVPKSTAPVAVALARPTASPVPINVYAADNAVRLAAAVSNIPQRVYVPNSLAGTVDVIDPLTYAVIDHYTVGKLPHHITPSWDLKHLYVNNTRDSSLTVIDPATGRPVETIAVTDPYNLYFTPDGTKAIVVAERDRSLDFRDPHSWSLIKSVAIPWRGVDHLDFSADGRYLVASTEFSGRVVRVDAVAMSVTDHISVGGQPVDVKLAPDGSVFFVANQVRDGVSVIDPQPLREIAFIATGRGAHGLCVSRDSKWLYVSNRREGSISVIDFRRRQVVAKWQVGGSPDMMQVSPDGAQLWVSNRYGASVSVIDTRSGRLLHQIAVGPGPHGLSYFPQPGRFSIGHNGVYR
jgi:YVTN family beta-propeller protein